MFDPAESARDLDKTQYLTGENLQFTRENTNKGHFTVSLLIIIMARKNFCNLFWLIMDIMVLLLEARVQVLREVSQNL